jgi:transposase
VLSFAHQKRVFLCLLPVDMRKSFRGLCQLAESVLKENPASGHWFVFINRRRDRLKLLAFEGDGYSIYYKRLESGGFESPKSATDPTRLEIDITQLSLILQGIDLKSAKRRKRYRHAS